MIGVDNRWRFLGSVNYIAELSYYLYYPGDFELGWLIVSFRIIKALA